MGKAELFAYLAAFVTIVLAVAMTDMIQSTHRLLRARKRVAWDARPLVFAVLIFLAVVSEFFSLWDKLDLDSVSMGRLLWLLTTPIVFALLAYSVLPDDCPESGLDLGEFYVSERRMWVTLFLIATVLDLLRSMESFVSHGMALWPFFVFVAPSVALTFSGLAALYFSRGRVGSWMGLALLSGAMLTGVWGWAVKAQVAA